MKRIAVCFGLNAVDQEASDYDGWPGLLQGCVPDARDLGIVAARMGFESRAVFSGWNVAGKANPWVMTGDATAQAFIDWHERLQAKQKSDDVYIIGYSGHGGRYDTWAKFNAGETLCFYDRQMRDTELHSLMCGWKEGVRVLYIFDSCHSGGMYKVVKGAVKFYHGRHQITESNVVKSGKIVGNVAQFCACRASETASDGPQNGAFTGTALADWDWYNRAGKLIIPRRWFDTTAALMAQPGWFEDQHPVLNVLGPDGSWLDCPL